MFLCTPNVPHYIININTTLPLHVTTHMCNKATIHPKHSTRSISSSQRLLNSLKRQPLPLLEFCSAHSSLKPTQYLPLVTLTSVQPYKLIQLSYTLSLFSSQNPFKLSIPPPLAPACQIHSCYPGFGSRGHRKHPCLQAPLCFSYSSPQNNKTIQKPKIKYFFSFFLKNSVAFEMKMRMPQISYFNELDTVNFLRSIFMLSALHIKLGLNKLVHIWCTEFSKDCKIFYIFFIIEKSDFSCNFNYGNPVAQIYARLLHISDCVRKKAEKSSIKLQLNSEVLRTEGLSFQTNVLSLDPTNKSTLLLHLISNSLAILARKISSID
ncbi:hypothetical protein VP01_1401g1 [Puccinia sorghi]|uniref:Uncharacterized protein n=1 Tax=Puccinia sorghi TaxID=27349 RepID=A0A0L6VL48_9BASI|nr:hypothetical protein VP01_1401g1 [Puccinia sorghi]